MIVVRGFAKTKHHRKADVSDIYAFAYADGKPLRFHIFQGFVISFEFLRL